MDECELIGVRADAGPDIPSRRAGGGLFLVTSLPEAASLILTAVFGILSRDDTEALGDLRRLTAGMVERRDSTSGPPTTGSTSWKLKEHSGGFLLPGYVSFTHQQRNFREIFKSCHFKSCSL